MAVSPVAEVLVRYGRALAQQGWWWWPTIALAATLGCLPAVRRRFSSGPRWAPWALLGLVVALGLAWAWSLCWASDDAYISFRYATNLARGQGLVFNPGERVEGYTNFLWTVIVAGLIGSASRPARARLCSASPASSPCW